MARSVKQYINGIVMTVFFAAIIVSCTDKQLSNSFSQIAQDTQDGNSQVISANKGTATLTANEDEANNDTPNANANPFTLFITEYAGALGVGGDVDYYPINKSFTDGSIESPLIKAELEFPDNRTFKIELIKKTGNNPEQAVITWIGNSQENLWVSYKPVVPNNDQYFLKVSSPNNNTGAYTIWCKVSGNGRRYLFDVAHGQIAGNADWVIDGISNRLPYPSQLDNGLNNDASWSGNYSSIALFLAKIGHEVQSLPVNSTITYGGVAPTDLKYFDVLVLSEPNKRYSQAEINAIRDFVILGGKSVLMIGDHTIDAANGDGSIPNVDHGSCLIASDRDNDGWDSPRILNQILRNPNNNSYDMGIEFNLTAIAKDACNSPEVTTNRAALNNVHVNYVLKGRNGIQGHSGTVGPITGISYYWGSTMKCTGNEAFMLFAEPNMPANSNNNNDCRAALSEGIGNNGNGGRIVAFGDSSPFNDNTGYDYNDTNSPFNSWLNDSHGNSQNHRNIMINALLWLGKVPEKDVLAP